MSDESRANSAPDARLRAFLRSAVPSFALCLIVSTALVYTLSFAFESAPDLRSNVALTAAVCALILAVLHVSGWSRKAALAAGIGTAVVCIAVVAALAAAMPGDVPLFVDPSVSWATGDVRGVVNDVAENYTVFGFVLCAVPILVFLLSRRPIGMVFLLAAAVLGCGMVQFLYRDWLAQPASVFAPMLVLAGILALFMFQTYRQSVLSAKRVAKTAFGGMAAFAAVTSLICVVFGMAVFFGAVDRLDLQTVDVRPFEVHHAHPVETREGVYQQKDLEGDETTDRTNDKHSETSEDGPADDKASGGLNDTEGMLNTPIGQAVQYLTGYDPDSPSQDRMEIYWLIVKLTAAVIAIFVLLALIAAVMIQRHRRSRRLKKMASLPRSAQAIALYNFLVERLRRLGIRKPAQLTPFEFALGTRTALEPFTRGANGSSFLDATVAYVDSAYGDQELEQDKYEKLIDFYKAFFKNAREYAGWPKWLLWKFWRI